MARLRLLVTLGCAAVSLGATPLFVPGDLMWATFQTGKLFEISTGTTGQNYSGVLPALTLGAMTVGQMAFSEDAQTGYVSVYGSNKVVAISASGQVTDFASVNTPSGLLRTSTGRLLVASYGQGKVYDITTGTPVEYASGLSQPRNLLETAAGIYIADAGNKAIKKLVAGNMATVAPFVSNILALSLASYNNRLYATSTNTYWVYDVTNGGALADSMAYAKGRKFASLAVAGGKLYAGTDASATGGTPVIADSGIWDVSAGGTIFSLTSALAYNLPLSGNSLLSAVPNPVVVPPPPPPPAQIPEPGTAVAGAALLALGMLRSRRTGA